MHRGRRRLVMIVVALLVAAVVLIVFGPDFLAKGISDGWTAVCHALGWEDKTPATIPVAPPADPSASAKPIKVTAGEAAPDFTLRDVDGAEFHLADLTGKRPVVIEFGSYT
jgi:hypothetical protein